MLGDKLPPLFQGGAYVKATIFLKLTEIVTISYHDI